MSVHLAQVNIARMKAPLQIAVDEAKQRLAHLEEHGSSAFAFTFRNVHPPDESLLSGSTGRCFSPVRQPAELQRLASQVFDGSGVVP